MKKITGTFLLLFLVLTLLAGCSSGPSGGTHVQDVPIYSNEEKPRQDVPYYDDLSQPSTPPSNTPEGLLTVQKLQEMYQDMGFREYQLKSEQSVSLYLASSDSSQLVVEESDAGIVSAVRLVIEATDVRQACDTAYQFLSIAVGRELLQEEKDSVLMNFTALSESPEELVQNSKALEIDDTSFLLTVNVEAQQYIINW